VGRQEAPARCVGCGLRFRENALDEAGLCVECRGEFELENFSDLDDEEGGDAA
jgi:hypothetical protein